MSACYERGPLAQLVEQGTFNPKAAGSTPSRPTMHDVLEGRAMPAFFVPAELGHGVMAAQGFLVPLV